MDTNEFSTKLKETILTKDKQETMRMLTELKELVRTNVEFTGWITEPVNLTTIKQMLIDNLNVQPRAMQLKQRPSTRRQRALMFSIALENGVKHIL